MRSRNASSTSYLRDSSSAVDMSFGITITTSPRMSNL